MLERVVKFVYLGDVINEDGNVEVAISARIRSAWGKFKELSSILVAKKVSNKMKGRVYVAGVRSCLLYGSETWAMTKEQEVSLERTEMWMAR